ncbi:MAG: rod shape-determining protein MreC [Candidatus Yonathbacteria bacterium]|nr:rod shape-determining protein MreC [Candidatus Yonathbacteria bacterium]
MIHHRDSQFLSPQNIALIVIVAISAFALLYAPVRGVLTQAVFRVAPGIWGVGDSIGSSVNSFTANLRDKSNLIHENAVLKESIDQMQVQVLDRNLLEEKVKKLEEALGRAQSDNRVVAYVFSGAGASPYDTLVVDVGAEHGVAVGNMTVYAGFGAVGEVVEVAERSSKVKLYSSPGEEHLVVIGPNVVPARALGVGMGNFESKVPQDSLVSAGDDVVMTKGGLILGKVSFIEENPAEPFKRLFFRTQFNISEIPFVEIIVDKRS